MLNEKRLSEILGVGLPKLEVNDIHWRSEESTDQSVLFYRMTDDEKAGPAFIERMKKARFAWLVVNRSVENMPGNATVVSDELWPEIQKKILDVLYPMPKLKFMALTGTNGKTTTTDLILQLGSLLGKKGISIGTLGVRENHKTILDFGLTSPSLIDLRKFLSKYGADKDFCVLEASSHALVQKRLYGIEFDGAGWLSFSQDHLDYHQSMEDYFEAKCLLFNQLKENATLYVPGEQQELLKKLEQRSSKVAVAPGINASLPVFFQTRFNQNNLEVAKAVIEDVFKVDVPDNFNALTAPDGRFYIRSYKTNYIIVDFAHTPDALENICEGIKKAFPSHQLKVLFGCGGDRDRNKRPKMAEVVDNWADEIYVTSDNPRNEDPDQILKDIIKGISKKPYKAIIERSEAVKQAFTELKENEVLLLAGKGHEDYILRMGVKHPYSDICEVDQFLSRNGI